MVHSRFQRQSPAGALPFAVAGGNEIHRKPAEFTGHRLLPGILITKGAKIIAGLGDGQIETNTERISLDSGDITFSRKLSQRIGGVALVKTDARVVLRLNPHRSLREIQRGKNISRRRGQKIKGGNLEEPDAVRRNRARKAVGLQSEILMRKQVAEVGRPVNSESRQ